MVFPYQTRFSLSFKVFPPSFDDELVVFLLAPHIDLLVLLFHSSLAIVFVLRFMLKLIHQLDYDGVVAEY